MAGKLFLGFDINKASNTLLTANGGTSSTTWVQRMCIPVGVYHRSGAATRDINATPPAGQTVFGCIVAGRIAGGAYGPDSSSGGGWGYLTTARTTWATAQGHQLAIAREQTGIGNEIYMTWDMRWNYAMGPSWFGINSTYEATQEFNQMFSWGDLRVGVKSAEYNTTSLKYTTIFSVKNNGSEIATVAVPGYIGTDWMFASLHAKLDGTTGMIEFACNGVTQSVPYTNQNTISSISLASASSIFIGPPVGDNGTNAYVGAIDNVYVDDSSYPEGRPTPATFTLLADDSVTDWAGVNTANGAPITVVVAIDTPTTTNTLRSISTSAVAVLTQTPPATTSYLNNVLGIDLVCKRASNRHPRNPRRIVVGYSLSGIETLGTVAKTVSLFFTSAAAAPEDITSRHPIDQIFEKAGGGLLTTSELSTMKIVLKSSSP